MMVVIVTVVVQGAGTGLGDVQVLIMGLVRSWECWQCYDGGSCDSCDTGWYGGSR